MHQKRTFQILFLNSIKLIKIKVNILFSRTSRHDVINWLRFESIFTCWYYLLSPTRWIVSVVLWIPFLKSLSSLSTLQIVKRGSSALLILILILLTHKVWILYLIWIELLLALHVMTIFKLIIFIVLGFVYVLNIDGLSLSGSLFVHYLLVVAADIFLPRSGFASDRGCFSSALSTFRPRNRLTSGSRNSSLDVFGLLSWLFLLDFESVDSELWLRDFNRDLSLFQNFTSFSFLLLKGFR